MHPIRIWKWGFLQKNLSFKVPKDLNLLSPRLKL